MKTRHAGLLMTRLEQVFDVGAATLTRGELLRWYAQERMSHGIWRDVLDRWVEEIHHDEEGLFMGEHSGVYTLILGQGLKATDQAWFRPLKEKTKKEADRE